MRKVEWTRLPDLVERRVRVTLHNAPVTTVGNVTARPVEACWVIVPWGVNGMRVGQRVGAIIVEGVIQSGKDSKSGGNVVWAYNNQTQPDWLRDVMAEAVELE